MDPAKESQQGDSSDGAGVHGFDVPPPPLRRKMNAWVSFERGGQWLAWNYATGETISGALPPSGSENIDAVGRGGFGPVFKFEAAPDSAQQADGLAASMVSDDSAYESSVSPSSSPNKDMRGLNERAQFENSERRATTPGIAVQYSIGTGSPELYASGDAVRSNENRGDEEGAEMNLNYEMKEEEREVRGADKDPDGDDSAARSESASGQTEWKRGEVEAPCFGKVREDGRVGTVGTKSTWRPSFILKA